MRRQLVLAIMVGALALACSNEADEPVPQPSSVELSIDLTYVRTDGVAWGVIWEGWWDGETASAVLTEDGEPIWFEHDRVVTRSGVSVPDLTTPWVEFDLASWGAIDYTHRDFSDLGAAVEFWGSPSARSLMAIRELVVDQRLPDGTTTTAVPGSAFLEAVDETIARRSLVDCAGEAEIQATIADGVVTEVFFELHTGAFLRLVRVSFAPWEGELPDPPTDSEITRSLHRRGDEPPPVRQPIGCDHDPQDPVEIDRAGCPRLPDERSEAELAALTRHAESTPAVDGRFWVSVATEIDLDEMRRRLADHELKVSGMNAQAETVAFGVMGFHGAEIDGLPSTPAELEALIESEVNRALIPGTTAITAIEVDGTWGDIARFASDCAFISANG